MEESILVAAGASGALTYAVPLPPERLPPVRPGALLAAWDLARAAADQGAWGPPRRLVFHRAADEPTVIEIADPDASCWAEALDQGASLSTLTGLALCLRLLALVEVMGRAGFLAGLFDIGPGGVELHPALLRAAATMPLDAGARFDAEALRRLLSRQIASGVSA